MLSATCPHRPPCSACPRFGEAGIAGSVLGRLHGLSRLHQLPPVEVVAGRSEQFRMRARLAIRGRLGAPKLGLFEMGTHRVVHIPNCRVHHPLINRVAAVVRRALVDAEVTCYSDKAHLGIARYLQVVIERSSQTAQVVLVGNTPQVEPLAHCLDLIRERLGAELHSLWFNPNCGTSNTILGPDFVSWCGLPSVVERFGGAAIHYPPGAFGQSNLDIAERIIERVRDEIPPGARVAEFYAGVGAIGLSILPKTSALYMNEIGARSLQGLELGLAGLATEEQAKVRVVPGIAGAASRMADRADVVIADPPRKGLDPELCAHLCEAPPARFIYVSCGWESLVGDVGRLTAGGRLRLGELTAFNLMPYTDHVETVARFERVA